MALNKEGDFEKIKDTGRAVFLITFNKDHSKILMLKRNIQKRDFWGVSWGNIGGKIDPGESSTEAIIRETFEESGMQFNEEDLKLLHIKEIQHAKENWHPIHFFYGASIDENKEVNINLESEEYCWFELDDLPEDMFDSREFILFLKSIFTASD
jgi:8-oxo-dGTP pyrophosphatase MutT (NUDIX family)